ncbi:MAG TPA: hypothetical protein VFB72_16225 [Verrucomicrobiae bacterium]|nr:hypothetical protein [Verrucomicrobiae bacterium]
MAVSLCCLIFFILLLEAWQPLHLWFHPDADSPGHACAVVMFAKGMVEATVAIPVLVAAIHFFCGINLLPELALLPAPDFQYSQERAPPASVLG